MKKIVLIAFMLGISILYAQDSTKTNPLTISGYAEAYYTYDFNRPLNNTYALAAPPFRGSCCVNSTNLIIMTTLCEKMKQEMSFGVFFPIFWWGSLPSALPAI